VFGFIPESLFTFSPESRSPYPGIRKTSETMIDLAAIRLMLNRLTCS